MAFIFTSMPEQFVGRRPALEAYLNQMLEADQEQIATDAGITFTPGQDIDVATSDDYTFLAVNADAATVLDYTGVDVVIRDKYTEAKFDAFLPEDKWALVQGTTMADKLGPVFAVSSEVLYLETQREWDADWASLGYTGTITGRDSDKEDLAMKLSGTVKASICANIPTASYGSDVLTGLFAVDGQAEYDGVMNGVTRFIKLKK